MQLALHLTATPQPSGRETAGQAERLPSTALEDALTIHDPAQLWFAFVRQSGR